MIFKGSVTISRNSVKSSGAYLHGSEFTLDDMVVLQDKRGNTATIDLEVLWRSLIAVSTMKGLTPEDLCGKIRALLTEGEKNDQVTK